MTVRDAILLSVPVFAANTGGGPDALRAELAAAGIPPRLAAEVAEFLPLAVARAMLDGMGVHFEDHYVRTIDGGRVVGEKRLADEPVFREGLTIAGEISVMGQDEFMAVAGWSSEYRAIQEALAAGARAEDLRCPVPVVYARGGDRRAFDDTSGGRQLRRAWWRFWG